VEQQDVINISAVAG
ncbi:hypothetical protein CapIbe_024115, partial [Capra ibex]